MPTENALQFNDLAAMYEDMAQWPFRRDIEIPSVMEVLGDVRGKAVLDFGCGTGMYARWLKQRGAGRTVGYDPTEGMLNYARRRAEKEGFDIAFTARLGPELAGQFDIVLSVYVLPYASTWAELQAMCGEMVGLLRPGGRLVALPVHPRYEPAPGYYSHYGFRLIAENPQAPYRDGGAIRLELDHGEYQGAVTAWYWSAETLEEALREAGLRTVHWHDPHSPAHPDPQTAPEVLRAYLEKPHAAIVEGERG